MQELQWIQMLTDWHLLTKMANVMGQEKDGITAAEAIIMKLREMATKGDIKAAQLLLDRGYGKAKQNIDITTQGEKVTVPTIIFTKENKQGE